MSYRSDLDAMETRRAALAKEVRERGEELAVQDRMLDEARAKLRLPVLDRIGVASPCSEDWDAMTGDDRVRVCGSCKQNVYNLSELTRDEAESLIEARAGRLCVQYFQRKDGTILLKDCEVGAARQRRRKKIAAVGLAAAMVSGGTAYAVFAAATGRVERVAPPEVRTEVLTVDVVTPPAPPAVHRDPDVSMIKGQMIIRDVKPPARVGPVPMKVSKPHAKK